MRLAKFKRDRVICFIPPDGEFELMSYRLGSYVKPPVRVECESQMYRNRVKLYVHDVANFKCRFTATDVDIVVPVHSGAYPRTSRASQGAVCHVTEDNVCRWYIKYLRGTKEVRMASEFGLPSASKVMEEDSTPPVRVNFKMGFFTMSGIKIRYLRVVEKEKYDPLVWVKYMMNNGNY